VSVQITEQGLPSSGCRDPARSQARQTSEAGLAARLGTRPGPVLDEDQRVKLAEIRAVQQYRAMQAPPPALPPLPANYACLSPAEQASADLERRRVQLQAQQVAIDAAREDDVIDAEIVDE
jgi:hypothetical protein